MNRLTLTAASITSLSDVVISQHLSDQSNSEVTTAHEFVNMVTEVSKRNVTLVHQLSALNEAMTHERDFSRKTLLTHRNSSDRGLKNITAEALGRELRFNESGYGVIGNRSTVYNVLSEKRMFASIEIKKGRIGKEGKVYDNASTPSVVIYIGLSNLNGIGEIVKASGRRAEALMHKYDYQHNFGNFSSRNNRNRNHFAQLDEYLSNHVEAFFKPVAVANYRLAPDDFIVGRAYEFSDDDVSAVKLAVASFLNTPYQLLDNFLISTMAVAKSFDI